MVQFADWLGREIRLVYYPPYQSKYNPIARARPTLPKYDMLIKPRITERPPKSYPPVAQARTVHST
jgi:hypothetical protein